MNTTMNTPVNPFEEGFEKFLQESGLEKEAQETLREALCELDPVALSEAYEVWETTSKKK